MNQKKRTDFRYILLFFLQFRRNVKYEAMKNITPSFLGLLFLPIMISGQDCSFYYPQLEGARLVY